MQSVPLAIQLGAFFSRLRPNRNTSGEREDRRGRRCLAGRHNEKGGRHASVQFFRKVRWIQRSNDTGRSNDDKSFRLQKRPFLDNPLHCLDRHPAGEDEKRRERPKASQPIPNPIKPREMTLLSRGYSAFLFVACACQCPVLSKQGRSTDRQLLFRTDGLGPAISRYTRIATILLL